MKSKTHLHLVKHEGDVPFVFDIPVRCDDCKHWGGETAFTGACARIGRSYPIDSMAGIMSDVAATLLTNYDFGCAAFSLEDAGVGDP